LVEIRKEIAEIILSDLNMPGMSGFELLSLVRARFPSIRLIAMSDASLQQMILHLSLTGFVKLTVIGRALLQL
jgi:DNA-binding NarL/FixJ family response regulator